MLKKRSQREPEFCFTGFSRAIVPEPQALAITLWQFWGSKRGQGIRAMSLPIPVSIWQREMFWRPMSTNLCSEVSRPRAVRLLPRKHPNLLAAMSNWPSPFCSRKFALSFVDVASNTNKKSRQAPHLWLVAATGQGAIRRNQGLVMNWNLRADLIKCSVWPSCSQQVFSWSNETATCYCYIKAHPHLKLHAPLPEEHRFTLKSTGQCCQLINTNVSTWFQIDAQ